MYTIQQIVPVDRSCRQAAGRIVRSINQLREPFRNNTLRWLESCLAHPIEDVDEDLTQFFNALNPGMRESTISNMQHLVEEAVRHFGQA
jgi:hypothetical protein